GERGCRRAIPSAASATTACCCRSRTTAATERRSRTKPGCAAIPRAGSTFASTTARSVSGGTSARPPSDRAAAAGDPLAASRTREPRLIRAIVFDLDNTLTDFMKMKADAIEAAIDGMIDAGLAMPREALRARIDAIYQERGLEYQNVFDEL